MTNKAGGCNPINITRTLRHHTLLHGWKAAILHRNCASTQTCVNRVNGTKIWKSCHMLAEVSRGGAM